MSDRDGTDYPDGEAPDHGSVDLADSGELLCEVIGTSRRRPPSGVRAAIVRAPESRPSSQRRGARRRVSTSTSASSGWAARFSKLSRVRVKDGPDDT